MREFINRVKEKAVGHEVNKSLTPGQEFVKIVRNELVAAMGEENQTLNLAAQPPAVVLMAGLQGAVKQPALVNSVSSCARSTRRKCWWFLPTSIARRQSNSLRRWQSRWALISSF